MTLPKEIRDHLQLKAGDRVDFTVDEAGRVLLQPMGANLEDLWGLLHEPGREPVSIEDMEAPVRRERGRR